MTTMKTLRIKLEAFPKSERTFLKWCNSKKLNAKLHTPLVFRNDNGHPCEYLGYTEDNRPVMMVKYYRGRLLATYGICT